MLTIAHSLTGALIASQLPSPLLYIPLTLGAHYLQDAIPHIDAGTGINKGTRKKSTALMIEVLDSLIAIILIYFLWQRASSHLEFHIWLAALVGILPDLIEAPKNFFKTEPKWTKPLNDFHQFVHRSTENWLWGSLPQIVIMAVVIFLKQY